MVTLLKVTPCNEWILFSRFPPRRLVTGKFRSPSVPLRSVWTAADKVDLTTADRSSSPSLIQSHVAFLRQSISPRVQTCREGYVCFFLPPEKKHSTRIPDPRSAERLRRVGVLYGTNGSVLQAPSMTTRWRRLIRGEHAPEGT